MLKYDAHHYDDQLNLKISPLLWLTMFYGVRHFFFVAAAKLMPHDVGATPWMDLQAHAFFMLSDLPALMVLLAVGHRIPDASRIMRWVWLHGHMILAGSYLLGVAVFLYLYPDALGNYNNYDFIAALCVVLPDLAIVGYLLRSELIRDIFSEFPETTAEIKAKAAARPKPANLIHQLEHEPNQELIIKSRAPTNLQTAPGSGTDGTDASRKT